MDTTKWPHWVVIAIGLALSVATILCVIALVFLAQFVSPKVAPTPTWDRLAFHPVSLENEHAELDCNDCHVTGESTAHECSPCHDPPSEPHYGDNCYECHQMAAWGELAPEMAGGLPQIPHPLFENAAGDCRLCHDAGQMVPFPDDHVNWTNDQCTSCHKFMDEPRLSPNKIAHTVVTERAENCVMCHGEEKIIPYSTGHEVYALDTCQLCHSVAPDAVALSASTVHVAISEYEGPQTCAECHPDAGREVAESVHYQQQSIAYYVEGAEPNKLYGMMSTY